jgi:hypothetical protein
MLYALVATVLVVVALNQVLGQAPSNPRGGNGAFIERNCDDPLLAVTACASKRNKVVIKPCTRSDPADSEVSSYIVNALPGTRELAKQGFDHKLCVHVVTRSR